MQTQKCGFKYPTDVPGLNCVHQGKVRNTYEIPGRPDIFLVTVTDRVSTHNVVHNSTIPNKGYALCAINNFWMKKFKENGIKTHLVASGKEIYDFLPKMVYPADLHLRAIIIKRLNMIPVEFILRDFMAGSLWKDFYSKGIPNPYGIELPTGLKLMSKFAGTIFTPTDKSETDDPISTLDTIALYEGSFDLAYEVYTSCRDFAITRGIRIIDGKFEIGIDPDTGEEVLGDECATPDSCRFVPGGEVIIEGKDPTWLDKQPVREEAERLWAGGPKVPLTFSNEIITRTAGLYSEIFYTLTGQELETL